MYSQMLLEIDEDCLNSIIDSIGIENCESSNFDNSIIVSSFDFELTNKDDSRKLEFEEFISKMMCNESC